MRVCCLCRAELRVTLYTELLQYEALVYFTALQLHPYVWQIRSRRGRCTGNGLTRDGKWLTRDGRTAHRAPARAGVPVGLDPAARFLGAVPLHALAVSAVGRTAAWLLEQREVLACWLG